MRSHVKDYVGSCLICQKAKPDRSKYPGLLQSLPTPDEAWQVVSLDFIEGLPTSSKQDCILVVVDKLTRYAHFVPLSHPFTAQTVALAYFDHVFKLHGLPKAIISDRDKIFTSSFWQQLFKLAGTQLCMSTAYHPQTDGQTEQVNQCLETFLRCFTHACPKQWSKWLSLAEFWYNTSPHSSLGTSPFKVLYGREPNHLGLSVVNVHPVPELQQWLDERQVMLDLVKQHLLRAQARIKRQADKNRSERAFKVGDQVLLKLQPYVQMSVAKRANHKLSFKYYGPYKVVDRVGAVAYRLALPSESRVHPVFHVSQLKLAKERQGFPQVALPTDDLSFQVPLEVLEYRWRKGANKMTRQGLILWSSSVREAATWEDLDDLHQRFPSAPAWVPIRVLDYRFRQAKNKQVRQGLVVWSHSTEETASWDDLDTLRRKFPQAPAWGQAGFQEEGIVSAKPVTPMLTKEPPSHISRPVRQSKPNSRVVGPDWLGPKARRQARASEASTSATADE
jgi:hypothetical protein